MYTLTKNNFIIHPIFWWNNINKYNWKLMKKMGTYPIVADHFCFVLLNIAYI